MGFQLFLQSKRENDFITHSIPIGSQPTIDIPVKQTPDSGSPCLQTPRAHISTISEYIGCLATILVRRERAPDSCSQEELLLRASILLKGSLLAANALLTR